MMICKDTVQNNAIVLEEGVTLPEGASVEIRVIEPAPNREEAFKRVLENPIRHYVGWDEILAEEKEERGQRHSL